MMMMMMMKMYLCRCLSMPQYIVTAYCSQKLQNPTDDRIVKAAYNSLTPIMQILTMIITLQ